MRKPKTKRRPAAHLFLGYKLLHELRILMRLASPANGRPVTEFGPKSAKSF